MWRGNRDYLLRVRIFVLGRTEKVVLRRHAEGSACSWTSSSPWLRHQNTEQWRRNKCRYRDVSRRNASTAWRTISIFRKILSFFCGVRILHLISFFSRFHLALSIIQPFRNTLTNCLKAWLQRKHHLYVDCCCYFSRNILWFLLANWIRFLLIRPQMPHYRSNWRKKSNHLVWEL